MKNIKGVRKATRAKYYNYENNGFYFVTICCDNYINYLARVNNGVLEKSKIGELVEKNLLEISNKFDFIKLYEYTIMPNHIHAIVIINDKKQSFGPWETIKNYAGKNNICYYDNRFEEKIDKKGVPQNGRGAIYRARKGGVTGDSNPMLGNSLGKVIRWFKARTSFEIHKQLNKHFQWQRNYNDNIIRNDIALANICYYIKNNPKNWPWDRNHKSIKRAR